MKAILVKYLPATNHRPSRFKVMAEGVKSVIVSRDSMDDDPGKAAVAFATGHDWLKAGETLAAGGLPNGDLCYCFTVAHNLVTAV